MDAHRANFREAHHLVADVSGLRGETLKSAFELEDTELSGIIGGPPCQGFSAMGRRKKNDGRNNLFVEFFRLRTHNQKSMVAARQMALKKVWAQRS